MWLCGCGVCYKGCRGGEGAVECGGRGNVCSGETVMYRGGTVGVVKAVGAWWRSCGMWCVVEGFSV